MSESTSATPDLVGSWRKLTDDPCAERYPAELRFAAGPYRGVRGDDQGMIWWDAGIYRLDDPSTLVVSSATDELETCTVVQAGNRLTITDADGCTFVYERIDAPPS